jgi:chemotaxis-related protein WspD
MSTPPAIIDDCWNTIGVQGNASCPELVTQTHCRNCPVYSSAAADLLDVESPFDDFSIRTRNVAQEKTHAAGASESVVVFRIGEEWLALPTTVFKEIADIRAMHSLPHRRNGVVLGLTNIRGELLICVSPRRILDMEPPYEGNRRHGLFNERLLVIEKDGRRIVFPVDEVHGVQRYGRDELVATPTLTRSATTCISSVLLWREKSVGMLDHDLLFRTIDRRLTFTNVS